MVQLRTPEVNMSHSPSISDKRHRKILQALVLQVRRVSSQDGPQGRVYPTEALLSPPLTRPLLADAGNQMSSLMDKSN